MTPIHHITHIANLPAIVREGALVCEVDAGRRELCAQSIAYDQIKERRRRRTVATLAGHPVAAGGMLPDYVPFYFSNRTPMLGAIHKGLVPAYQGGQADVIYLLSSVEAVAATRAPWCFTDGHAVEAVTEFFDDLGHLNKIEWEAIRTWRWGGRWLLDNPDVKRRKQAEFLVHGRFPWELVERIGVLDAAMTARVQAALAHSTHRPQVTIEPNWYFNQ